MGFMHFDIKPGNILVNLDTNNRIIDVKITDFGLCREKRDDYIAGKHTHGTINCLAPEMLIANHKFDHRVDAWSLGIILYFMLTAKFPFYSSQ